MAYPRTSFETCERTLAVWAEENGNHCAAARRLNTTEKTVRDHVAAAKRYYPGLHENYAALIAAPKPSAPAPKTVAEEAAEQAAKATERSSAARLKDALKEIAALNERIANLEWGHNVTLKPAEWALRPTGSSGRSLHIPTGLFSDAQAGEVVRADETETPWDYSSEIFRQRYRKMISMWIDLALNHAGSRWEYPHFVYCRNGDLISGGLHVDLRELGEDSTVIEQCELVAEEESSGIEKLVEAFGKVIVETPGGGGNHDRNTFKPPSKLAWARTYDRLIHKLLSKHFARDPRVIFHTSKSPDIRFPVFNKTIFMSHGDKIGSSGGMGFIGPGATILRGWQKLLMEQAQLGYHFDMIFTGHFHYPMALPTLGIGNGSFTGTTEFGKLFRFSPQPPLQFLAFFHELHGCIDIRPIYIAEK